MCVVSMIMEHYHEKWIPYIEPVTIPNQVTPILFPIVPKMPSQEEIDEFYKLLGRAREYDKKNNEPDCEMQEKKDKLLKLAEELGIEIKFD